jgi:hypothetical protein
MTLQIRSPAHHIKTLDLAHTAATVARVPVVINTHVLIPTANADANALNGYYYDAEVSGVPKAVGAIAVLDKLYWDAANSVLTKTATDNTLFGYALEASASADTVTGLVAFNAFAA